MRTAINVTATGLIVSLTLLTSTVGCDKRATPAPAADSSHAAPMVATVTTSLTSLSSAPSGVKSLSADIDAGADDLDKPGPVVVTPRLVYTPDMQHAKTVGWSKDSSELGVCAEAERTGAYECRFLKPRGVVEEVTDFNREFGVDAKETRAIQARVAAHGYGASALEWAHASELTLTWKSTCDAAKATCVLRVGAAIKGEAPVYPIYVETKDVDGIHPEAIAISRDGKWLGVTTHSMGGNGDSQYDMRIIAVPTLVSQVYNDTGFSHHKQGNFARSAQLFHRALTINSQNKLSFYNYACALAKQSAPNVEAALKAAIEAGGDAVKKRARKDPDFATVTGEAWFIALTQ